MSDTNNPRPAVKKPAKPTEVRQPSYLSNPMAAALAGAGVVRINGAHYEKTIPVRITRSRDDRRGRQKTNGRKA